VELTNVAPAADGPADHADGLRHRAHAAALRRIAFVGGAVFVIVPNSGLAHAALRTVLGFGGYQCC